MKTPQWNALKSLRSHEVVKISRNFQLAGKTLPISITYILEFRNILNSLSRRLAAKNTPFTFN